MTTKVAEVRIADVQPVARFIAEVAKVDQLLRGLSKAEVYALPDRAVQAISVLQSAVRDLGAKPTVTSEYSSLNDR